MTEKRDYYEVLGLERDCSDDDIRKAYRQAALKYHPDRNPDDPAATHKFKEATEAYSVLSDGDKRPRYDKFGHAGIEGGGFDFGASGMGDIFSHFQDLFSDFFGGAGGGAGRTGPRRGSDLRVEETLSLRDAMAGTKREVVVHAPAPCDECEGSGAAPGAKREACSTCRGAGQVSTARGFVMFTTTCPSCHGQGSRVTEPCPSCTGEGQVEKTRKVIVSFPAGIDNNQRLRVPGQGLPGTRNGPSGDLYVDVSVEADERFDREGADLITETRLSFADAALGTTVAIAMPDDSSVEVEVPSGAQPGDVLSIKGKGVQRLDGRGRGALHVRVQVEVPRKLSSRARDLLRELDEELDRGAKKQASSG